MSRSIFLLCALAALVVAQVEPAFDVVIRNGFVIDPKNNIDRQRLDVAVKDGFIAEIGALVAGNGATEIDASGLFVTPGLIDLHTHVFYGTDLFFEENGDDHVKTRVSIQPDAFTFRTGTTTIVDAGSSGWTNFEEFKRTIIDVSNTRVLVHLNIVEYGLQGELIKEQALRAMDPIATGLMARQFDDIVGIKVAHYASANYVPVELGVEAGIIGDVPIIVHFPPDPLPLSVLLLEKFRPGDILTHCYANLAPTEPIVNPNTLLLEDFAREARERGVFFDIGNGGSAFRYDVALPALQQGFPPDSISTDIKNVFPVLQDMTTLMSKFLAMGVDLFDIIAMTTWNPAQEIKQFHLGHLEVGDEADIALFSLESGQFGYVDGINQRLDSNERVIAEMTLRAGEIMFDLNGLSAMPINFTLPKQ